MTICKFTFSVKDRRLRQRWTPLVNISLHALARHIERSRDRSPGTLVNDITLLADVPDDEERTATPHGFWLGGCVDALDGQDRVIKLSGHGSQADDRRLPDTHSPRR